MPEKYDIKLSETENRNDTSDKQFGEIEKIISDSEILPSGNELDKKNAFIAESSNLQMQQPDLVASIKERPSHLPGVQSYELPPGI